MTDQTDPQLLRAYAGSGSEAAYAELVRRHVDLVYSAALRMVRDPHLAEDSRKAYSSPSPKALRNLSIVLSFPAGWIARHGTSPPRPCGPLNVAAPANRRPPP